MRKRNQLFDKKKSDRMTMNENENWGVKKNNLEEIKI